MEQMLSAWNADGPPATLERLLAYKLVFIETPDIVESSLALKNFRRACDSGRGAIFMSVARGKVCYHYNPYRSR
jgi:DNA excision repair protein ERCC-2